MFKRNHSLFTALLVLASLAGQVSAAVTLPCDLLSESAHTTTASAMPPGHHGMAMDVTSGFDAAETALDDCCADGVCTLSHCASYPPVGIDSPGLVSFRTAFWSAPVAVISYLGPPSLALFRPPISS